MAEDQTFPIFLASFANANWFYIIQEPDDEIIKSGVSPDNIR